MMSSRSAWVVDDESSMSMLMREALLQDGFDVVCFNSGERVVRACAAGGEDKLPDVILIDVNMPGMNGYKLCSHLKSSLKYTDIPVIMVTGRKDSDSIDQAYEYGAADYITKPVNWTQLHYRLHFVLRAADAMHRANLTADRLKRAEKVAKLGHLDWNIKQKEMAASAGVFHIFNIKAQDPDLFYTTFHQAIHANDRMHVDMAVNRSIATGVDLNVGFRINHDDGYERHVLLQGEVLHNEMGIADFIFATLDDISDHKKYQDTISHLAYYDEVTGIPNRTLFKEHLTLALHQAERSQSNIAVMFLDLDNFKRINDTLGHQAGDFLLKAVAERLSGQVRSSDVTSRQSGESSCVARLGGDEFTILLTDIEQISDVTIVVERIQREMKQPIMIEGQNVYATFSIGVASYPSDSCDASTLLKHADTAMYYGKQHGRNRCCFYHEVTQPESQHLLQLENDLHHALENEELQLYYQPKLNLKENRICGVEALLRWNHPDKGMISPNDFIPLAEKCGLMISIGEWVIRQGCKQIHAWQQLGIPDVSVAINFSAQQFVIPDLAEKVQAIITDEGVNPSSVQIELTESILMQDVQDAVQTLSALKGLGLHLALDDFGTGYSSMSYLKHFPMDTLKIDRSFIMDICDSKTDASITKSIISLAKNLDMSVVAEGVETDAQLALLRQYDCDHIQGYLFARPMPEQEATAFLQHHFSICTDNIEEGQYA